MLLHISTSIHFLLKDALLENLRVFFLFFILFFNFISFCLEFSHLTFEPFVIEQSSGKVPSKVIESSCLTTSGSTKVTKGSVLEHWQARGTSHLSRQTAPVFKSSHGKAIPPPDQPELPQHSSVPLVPMEQSLALVSTLPSSGNHNEEWDYL